MEELKKQISEANAAISEVRTTVRVLEESVKREAAAAEKISESISQQTIAMTRMTANVTHMVEGLQEVRSTLYGKGGVKETLLKLETSVGPIRRVWEGVIITAATASVLTIAGLVAKGEGL